jgi:hypothetical protein
MHPILVYSYEAETNIATCFLVKTTLDQPHRFLPLGRKAVRLKDQPMKSLYGVPPNSFDNRACYINFTHPIKFKVSYTPSKIQAERLLMNHPGIAFVKDLTESTQPVSLSLQELETLIDYHRLYWNGMRWKDQLDANGATLSHQGGGSGSESGGSKDNNDDVGGEGGGISAEQAPPASKPTVCSYPSDWPTKFAAALDAVFNTPTQPEDDDSDEDDDKNELPLLVVVSSVMDGLESFEEDPAMTKTMERYLSQRKPLCIT